MNDDALLLAGDLWLKDAICHAVNFHALDAKLNMADHEIAELLVDEVSKHLRGVTDAQIVADMTSGSRGERLAARHAMKIQFDEDDALLVAEAMAKSRRLVLDFRKPFPPDSAQDRIYTEALRIVAALRESQSK